MLISLQFPIADLRGFLEEATGRLSLPDWPMPMPSFEFVRGFGPISRRRRGITQDYLGEHRVCEAHHALRFVPVSRPEFRCAYRRYFFDGKAVGKFDIGLSYGRSTEARGETGAEEVLLRALGLQVVVPSIPGARPRALHTVSGQLARAYLLGSTARVAGAPVASWALGGRPLVVMESAPKDLLRPPAGARVVPCTLGPDITLHHYWLSPGGGVEVGCWLLSSSSGPAGWSSIRHLRICLAQLHASRMCLELVLHSIAAGKLSPPQGSRAQAALQAYLDGTRRALSSMRARSSSLGTGFTEAAEAAFEHINPFTSQYLEKLDEALRRLRLRYNTVKGALKEVGGQDARLRVGRPEPEVEQLGQMLGQFPSAPQLPEVRFPKVDVLIVTALKDERDAVLSYQDGMVEAWRSLQGPAGFNYHLATFSPLGASERPLTVAVARPIRMGELYTASLATRLMALAPSMLAMSGICAGDRRETKLGDIIVADRVFKFDYGKLKAVVTANGQRQQDIFHDLITYSPRARLIEVAQEWEGPWYRELPRTRPLSYGAQERWLLRTLGREGMQGTLRHPERRMRCPAWEEVLARLKKSGLLQAEGLALTERGIRRVADFEIERPDGESEEERCPSVFVAPIGTTSYVQEDPELFQRFHRLERKTLGVEMEGAAIGAVAELEGVQMLVVKAVSDHGDHEKDDQFRMYAAEASAWFLLDLLRRHWMDIVPGTEGQAANPRAGEPLPTGPVRAPAS